MAVAAYRIACLSGVAAAFVLSMRPMSGAQQAVEAFIEGRIVFQGLQRELERTLGGDVELAFSLIGDLEGRRDEGRLSSALFNIIETEIRRQSAQEVREHTLPEAMPAVVLQHDDTHPERTSPGFTGTVVLGDSPARGGPAEITADLGPAAEPAAKAAAGVPKSSEAVPPPASRSASQRLPEARLFQGRQALREGDLLAGRYQLEATLGRGGLGIVYRAVDERRDPDSDQNSVAIKVLRPEHIGTEDGRRMLEHEADQTRRLSHPNVIRIFDFDRDGEVWFITMELLRGERLKTLLARRHPEPLSGSEARRIIRAAADGLAHAHGRGVIHGDVKPSNIFVPNSGDVRLMDFGQAASVDPAGSSAPVPARTAAYASPQKLAGQGPSARDDVFALGCVAYEVLTGQHPFNRMAADEARARRMKLKRPPGLSGSEWKALSAALAFSAESRPATAAEFATAFFGSSRDVAEDSGAGTGAVLGAIVLGAVLGYLLGILVPAQSWLPIGSRSPSEPPAQAETETPGAPGTGGPSGPQGPQPEPGRQSTADSPEWVAPPALATVEIDAEGSTPAETPAGSPAAPDGGLEDVELPDDETTAAPAAAPVAAAVAGPGRISLAAEATRLQESDGVAVVDLVRTDGFEGAVAISYRTLPDSASEQTDYAGADWTEVRFESGQETARQFVPLVSDSLAESDESFVIEIGRPANGVALGPITRMRVTIADDD